MVYNVVVTPDAERDLDNFMLYRIVEDMVIIDSMFHELEDYENHLM